MLMDDLLFDSPELLSLEKRAPFKGLTVGRQLGHGAFATVYEGQLNGVGKVAVKVLHAELQPQASRVSDDDSTTKNEDQTPGKKARDPEEVTTAGKLFLREGLVMEKLSHRSVIKCYGVNRIPPGFAGLPVEKRDGKPVARWCMALQVCMGGSLRSLLTEQMRIRSAMYTTHDLLCWLLDIAEAVTYLHGQNPPVIHRDLKADNILLESRHVKGCRSHALITDLGLHVRVGTKHQRMLRRLSINGPDGPPVKLTSPQHHPSRFAASANLDVGPLPAAMSSTLATPGSTVTAAPMLSATQSLNGGVLDSKLFMSTNDAHAQGLPLPREYLDTLDKAAAFYDHLRSGNPSQSRSTPNAGGAASPARRNSCSTCQAGAVLFSLALKAGSQASMTGMKEIEVEDEAAPPLPTRSSAHVLGQQSAASSPRAEIAEDVGRRTHSGTAMNIRNSRSLKLASSNPAMHLVLTGPSRLSQVACQSSHGEDLDQPRLKTAKSGPVSQGSCSTVSDVLRVSGNSRKPPPAPGMVTLVPDESRSSFTIKAVRPTLPGGSVVGTIGEQASVEGQCVSTPGRSSRPQSEWAVPAIQAEAGEQGQIGTLAVRGLAGQVMQQLTPEELAWVWSLTGATGSCMYMAPEVHRGEPYNEKVDVFSFGVIAYELLSRSLLVFSHLGTSNLPGIHTPEEYVELVADGYRPTLHSPKNSLEQQLWQLIQRCWSQDPNTRPSMQDVALLLDVMYQEAELVDEAAESGVDKAGGCRCSIM